MIYSLFSTLSLLLLQHSLAKEKQSNFLDLNTGKDFRDADVISALVDADTKLFKDTDIKPVFPNVTPMKVGIPVGAKIPKALPIPKILPVFKPAPIPKTLSFPFVKPAAPFKLPNIGHLGHKKAKLSIPLVKLAKAPMKKVAAVVKAKITIPKLKALPLALKKPKILKLKPIVHVIHKPVPVFHKFPVPKKVLVPKIFPVFKPIPVPMPKFVPIKVPVIKILPKIVKIPKPIPVPKLIPVKKYIPLGIPIPIPKIKKFPLYKPIPFLKPFPIPVPVKIPKFVPFPVKKVVKVPKPFYVPVKIPHITKSYVKTPMAVPIPMKKPIFPLPLPSFAKPDFNSFAALPKAPASFQFPLGFAAPKSQFHHIQGNEFKFKDPILKRAAPLRTVVKDIEFEHENHGSENEF